MPEFCIDCRWAACALLFSVQNVGLGVNRYLCRCLSMPAHVLQILFWATGSAPHTLRPHTCLPLHTCSWEGPSWSATRVLGTGNLMFTRFCYPLPFSPTFLPPTRAWEWEFWVFLCTYVEFPATLP
jgi:hypothetical protein